jgi:hypothetical protein
MAPDAFAHIEVEAVLLAGLGRPGWNQPRAFPVPARRRAIAQMELGVTFPGAVEQ